MPEAADAEAVRGIVTIDSLAPDRGGPSRSIPALCNALFLGEGVRMHVVAHLRGASRPQELPSELRFETPRPRLGLGERAEPLLLRRLLVSTSAEVGAELLHDNGAWLISNHVSASVARRLALPWIVSPRGMLESWSMHQSRWKKRLAWRLYQHQDLASAFVFHATSLAEAESIRALGFGQPIAIIPNGVSMPAIFPRAERVSSVRTALFLSRIHPKKGVLDLIEAWARVRPRGWHLQIAGHDDGGHRSEVERSVERLGLSGAVSITGGVSDVDKWETYGGADLFILPTKSENFGIVIAEALASGLPVITTRGAPWESLTRYRCGWWVDLSVEALASAIEAATALPLSSLRDMGDRGRAYVQSELSWARVAREMRQLYQWILHRSDRPSFVMD